MTPRRAVELMVMVIGTFLLVLALSALAFTFGAWLVQTLWGMTV